MKHEQLEKLLLDEARAALVAAQGKVWRRVSQADGYECVRAVKQGAGYVDVWIRFVEIGHQDVPMYRVDAWELGERPAPVTHEEWHRDAADALKAATAYAVRLGLVEPNLFEGVE